MRCTFESLSFQFVYLGKSGCVEWDFGDGGKAFHSILGTDCSHFCEDDDVEECYVNDTSPNENGNRIVVT